LQIASYYSRSNDPNRRSIQNIFRGLSKGNLICKNNKAYEVTYRVSFIVRNER